MTFIITKTKTVMVIIRAFVFLSLLCLPGCGIFDTRVEIPKEIKVPVPIPCVKKADVPQAAFRSDEELLALDRYKRTIAIWDERRARQDLEAQQAAILASCTSKE